MKTTTTYEVISTPVRVVLDGYVQCADTYAAGVGGIRGSNPHFALIRAHSQFSSVICPWSVKRCSLGERQAKVQAG
eukprot:scaffold25128_cov36-Prasinocladus_malaysianus.AAC.1